MPQQTQVQRRIERGGPRTLLNSRRLHWLSGWFGKRSWFPKTCSCRLRWRASNVSSRMLANAQRGLQSSRSGRTSYKEKADRWSHFVEWMRYNLLYYRPRRQSNKNATRFYKEQRETMRALAMQVVIETADQEHIHHLADLARREIRRRRHEPTVRALLADQDQARQFLADFFLERDCLELSRSNSCRRSSVLAFVMGS